LEDQSLAGSNNFTGLRKEIAEVTLKIFDLCGERLQLVKQIAKVKAQQKIAVEDPRVEHALEAKVLDVCRSYDMDREFCLKLLALILKESKRVQRQVTRSEV